MGSGVPWKVPPTKVREVEKVVEVVGGPWSMLLPLGFRITQKKLPLAPEM
jgi:hypothetical protein